MIFIKKIFFIAFLIGWASIYAHASTDEKKIIEVTENIKYLSQKIANDYLHLYHNSKKKSIKNKLQNSIKNLEDDLRLIAKSTNNPDTKNILDFLSYNKDQMKETLEDDISKESVSAMLDFSDTLLEGAQSILDTKNHNVYDKKFHLMMISKLYMAINLDFDPINNKTEIKSEIELFNKSTALNSSWLSFKNILNNNQACFIPNIVSILIKDLENGMGIQ
jgi:hypothetical protein